LQIKLHHRRIAEARTSKLKELVDEKLITQLEASELATKFPRCMNSAEYNLWLLTATPQEIIQHARSPRHEH
jgi:hypothetical protein